MEKEEMRKRLNALIDLGSRYARPGDQKILDSVALLREAVDSLDATTDQELNRLSALLSLLPKGVS